MPPPSVGASNPEFEVKLAHLEQLVKRDGAVDCLIVGSSQIDGGINPVALTKAYAQRTGKTILCYNFGISTLTGEAMGVITRVLEAKYHPRLMFLGISPRDFSDQFGENSRPLLKNPWIQYMLGNDNYTGWLIDHSSAYRYYLGMTNWKDPGNRVVIEEYANKIDGFGYGRLPNHHTPLVQLDEVLLKKYKFNPSDVDGFRQALNLNGAQTRVVVIEMPVNPAFYPNYIEGGESAYHEKFTQPVSAMAEEYGVPFWQTQVEIAPQVPADGWNDRRHLNEDGAAFFSTWLGGKIADAQMQSQIPDLTQSASPSP
ncbi:MAG TPA: hypothetical protein VMT46_08730 [Anaerolineaceae bacterium]|nr:hypothetical protein [Anaerolineaceae bacterium]